MIKRHSSATSEMTDDQRLVADIVLGTTHRPFL